MYKRKKMESYNDAKKWYFKLAIGAYLILCLMVYMDNCVNGYDFRELLERIHGPIIVFTLIFIPLLTIMFFRWYPYAYKRKKALIYGNTYYGEVKAIKRIKGKGFNSVFYYLEIEYTVNGLTKNINSEYYISRPHQYVYENMPCQVFEYKGNTYLQSFFTNSRTINDMKDYHEIKSEERKYEETKDAYDEKADSCTFITEAESLKKRTKIITIIYLVAIIIQAFIGIYIEKSTVYIVFWAIFFSIFYLPSQVPVMIYCFLRDKKINTIKNNGEVYKGTVSRFNKIDRYKKFTLPGKYKDTFYVCNIEFYMNNKVFYFDSEPFVDMSAETVPLNFSCKVYKYNNKFYVDTTFFKDERSEQKFDIPTIEVLEKNILIEKEFRMQRVKAIYTKAPGYILPLPMKMEFKDFVTKDVVIDIKTDSSRGTELSVAFTKDLCKYIEEISKEKTSKDLDDVKVLISGKLDELLKKHYPYEEVEYTKITFLQKNQ